MQTKGESELGLQVSIDTTLTHRKTGVGKGIDIYEIINQHKAPENAIISVDKLAIVYLFSDKELPLSSTINDETHLIKKDTYAMLMFPREDWEITLKIRPEAVVKMVLISVPALHAIFGNLALEDAEMLQDAVESYKQSSFITIKNLNPGISSIIYQLFLRDSNGISGMVYRKSKIMEFLALYLEQDKEVEAVRCPFLTSDSDWEKIRRAEEIITQDIVNPPGIKELAKRVGTNEFKLKVGFKHVYKNTIFGYLNDYRMEKAKELLDKELQQIQEVSAQVGYTNTSHFINSFKKKYGITPKQYLKS